MKRFSLVLLVLLIVVCCSTFLGLTVLPITNGHMITTTTDGMASSMHELESLTLILEPTPSILTNITSQVCDSMPCSENQTCINTTDGFECECSPGFTLINSTCIKGSCADIGYDGCCNDLSTRCKGSDDKCYCDQACYGLNDCCFDIEDTGCYPPDIDECEMSPCLENQSCINIIGSFLCVCLPGFFLDNETCVQDINECDLLPCLANQKCINTDGSFICDPAVSSSAMMSSVLFLASRTALFDTPRPSASIAIKPSFVSPLTSATVPVMQSPAQPGELVQTVDVRLSRISESEFMLNSEIRLRFRVTVAKAVNGYCSESEIDCDLQTNGQLRKRQGTSHIYEADDVFIVSISQSGSSLIVTLFVRAGTPGTVLQPDVVVTILEEQLELFSTANFTIESVTVTRAAEGNDRKGLSGGEITGIVIGVIVVVLLFVSLLVILSVYIRWSRKQQSYAPNDLRRSSATFIMNDNYRKFH